MDESNKVSILIVDDRPDKLLALEAVLEDLQQNIVRAYSGEEALRHVLKHEFAVILLDVNMPGMDGFETAKLIRQRRSSAHVPIIFLTAMSDEMHVARGYSLGAVDYILTPVVPQVLKSKVSVFVDLFTKNHQVQRQAESLRRRAAQLQQLTAASVAINSALSTDKMLQTVTDTARDVIGAHQAITLFILPGGSAGSSQRAPRTQSFASFSDKYSDWRHEPLRLDPIANTLVARSHNATRLTETDLRDHPDWDIVRQLKIPPIRGGMLAAPLTSRNGNSLGVIYLSDRFDGNFSSDDEAVIVQLAQMASIAIENAIFAEERESNRLKDEFLSTLSHELRTPLNAISGWIQLLKMGEVKGEVGHGLDVIERNVRAQTKLIEDLLDLSRITTGKLRLNARHIDLQPILDAAAEGLRPTVQEKGITLTMHQIDEQTSIIGDPDRLQQVFWNLLSNAAKFTPAGGRIDVRLRHDEDSRRVIVSVTDSGEGIDTDFLPYVFDRFRQADSTSSRRHGGLGIGLTIVKHIVSLHGGSVGADSDGRGHGATFTVSLPIAVNAANGDTPRTSSSNGNADGASDSWPSPEQADVAPAEMPSLRNIRVLVVDDEPDAREVVAQMLRCFDAEVDVAGSADEALQCLREHKPDVLLTDLAMPERDGFALLRELRATNGKHAASDNGRNGNGISRIPAIAVTAYARPEDQSATLAAGFQAHISKPIDAHRLLLEIQRCIAGAPAHTEEMSAEM